MESFESLAREEAASHGKRVYTYFTMEGHQVSAKEIDQQGFCLVPSALDESTVRLLQNRCTECLAIETAGMSARSSQGHVYAARNVIEHVAEAKSVWRTRKLLDLLREILGDEFGLVRALFFDKPPDRTCSLPWHKDATIAVQDNSLPSKHFSRPTNKAGVPHVIASDVILGQMLTLRIHLDDVDDDNGPLKVIPQSHFSKHCTGLGPNSAVTIRCMAGDVLAMRPLIDHASGSSKPGVTRHRRILHLEFAGMRELPDGYRWHRFVAWGHAD
jgi:Phytanoyl-CoA dioxygenase (PhyH)